MPVTTQYSQYDRNLRSIDLSNCEITNETLQQMAAKHPEVETLILRKYAFIAHQVITDVGIRAVADGCKHLKNLSLEQCDQMTDQGAIYLANRCPDLETLNLSWTKITDVALNTFAAQCPRLRSITLYGCTEIKDEPFLDLKNRYPRIQFTERRFDEGVPKMQMNPRRSYCIIL